MNTETLVETGNHLTYGYDEVIECGEVVFLAPSWRDFGFSEDEADAGTVTVRIYRLSDVYAFAGDDRESYRDYEDPEERVFPTQAECLAAATEWSAEQREINEPSDC